MSEIGTRLREHYEQISPPLDTERLTEQFIGADRYRQRRRPAMAMAAAAVLTLLLIGGVGIMVLNDNSGLDVTDPPTTTVLPSGSWNPILADTRAKQPPPAAVCPEGADPDTAGPIDQATPNRSSPAVNQGAVFDQHAGRIVYVDRYGATWTFDVCTNTWQQAHSPIPGFDEYAAGDLVYDVDSDRTIGINSGTNISFNIFDAGEGTWTVDSESSSGYSRGAVYDPVSGLVVVALHDGRTPDIVVLGGYDVDTGEWSELGTVENVWGGGWMFLVGYAVETDELVFHGGYAPEPGDPLDNHYSAAGPTTVLYDLRKATTTVLPGGPNLYSSWGYWYTYATGVDGAVLLSDNRLCHFDASARTWDCTLDAANGPRHISEAAKMAYDPINDRLVVIYSGAMVWAVDLDTGQWTELG